MGPTSTMNRDLEVVVEIIEEIDHQGRTYFKSRDVARRCNLSAKRVGHLCADLEGIGVIERWSYSQGATTWEL